MKNILFLGNHDRSRTALMLAVFRLMLEKAGVSDVVCESAGISHLAHGAYGATSLAIAEAEQLNLDVRHHKPRWFATLIDMGVYSLFVCADKSIVPHVEASDIPRSLIYTADIRGPGVCPCQMDYSGMTARIVPAMDRLMFRVSGRVTPTG
jgi:hypothetical protein